MFNNYLPQRYHPYDKILDKAGPLGSVYLGDINAALDMEFINESGILTGKQRANSSDHCSRRIRTGKLPTEYDNSPPLSAVRYAV